MQANVTKLNVQIKTNIFTKSKLKDPLKNLYVKSFLLFKNKRKNIYIQQFLINKLFHDLTEIKIVLQYRNINIYKTTTNLEDSFVATDLMSFEFS